MKSKQILRNSDVEISALPQLERSVFHGLDPKYRNILFISAAIFWAILCLGAWIGIPLFNFPVLSAFRVLLGVFIILIVFGLIHFVLIALGFAKKGYAVRELDVSYKTGLVNRRLITIPYSRIQHVDVRQGVLERGYGLAKLNIYTAGGQGSDLSIPGLGYEDAQNLKSYILKSMSSDEEE